MTDQEKLFETEGTRGFTAMEIPNLVIPGVGPRRHETLRRRTQEAQEKMGWLKKVGERKGEETGRANTVYAMTIEGVRALQQWEKGKPVVVPWDHRSVVRNTDPDTSVKAAVFVRGTRTIEPGGDHHRILRIFFQRGCY